MAQQISATDFTAVWSLFKIKRMKIIEASLNLSGTAQSDYNYICRARFQCFMKKYRMLSKLQSKKVQVRLTLKISSVEFFRRPNISFSKHSLLILLQVRSNSNKVVFSSSALAIALHPSKYNPFQARLSFFRHVFS